MIDTKREADIRARSEQHGSQCDEDTACLLQIIDELRAAHNAAIALGNAWVRALETPAEKAAAFAWLEGHADDELGLWKEDDVTWCISVGNDPYYFSGPTLLAAIQAAQAAKQEDTHD